MKNFISKNILSISILIIGIILANTLTNINNEKIKNSINQKCITKDSLYIFKAESDKNWFKNCVELLTWNIDK